MDRMRRRSFLKRTGGIAAAWAVPTRKILGAARQAKSPKGIPDYTSRVPKYTFGNTLQEQEARLKANPLMLRFRSASTAA